MRLEGQRFSDYEKGSNFSITSMLPLSARYADVAKEVFTQKTDSGIRYQARNFNSVGAKYYQSFYYWEPTLDKEEWGIINYIVDNHQGKELTEKTDYFYRNYKGKKIFGIYSTDNDTLLYAVHEDNADKAYNYLKQYREEYRNGNESFTRTEESDPRLKSIWLQRNARNGNNGSFRQSRKSGSNAPLHGGESGIYAEAALRNVLENIFKERESSGDTGVKNQDRLSNADKNRLEILGNKTNRLSSNTQRKKHPCGCFLYFKRFLPFHFFEGSIPIILQIVGAISIMFAFSKFSSSISKSVLTKRGIVISMGSSVP